MKYNSTFIEDRVITFEELKHSIPDFVNLTTFKLDREFYTVVSINMALPLLF